MNQLNTLLLMVFLCLSSTVLLAQRNCGSMDYLQQQIEEHDHREDRLKAIEKHTARLLEQPDRSVSGTITIPVVVHVVYRNSTENISTSQIASQMQVLNEDFRRLNADASNTPSVFQGVAADVEVEFCLASSDPQGNPTDGITRTSTTVNGFGTNDNVKFSSSGGKDAWPASDYLNIWVCNIGGGILGYAQFPGGPANTDGVVVGYQYFGTTGTATAPFNLGRTATHEVGHYLNLRHIWGDGNCNADDFVTDTPRAGGPNYTGSPCNFPGANSCNEGSGDLPDMFQNYMDYSDDGCMNLFTAGQTGRMRALFAAGGSRASLLNSAGCGAPTPPTCNDGIQNGNETGVDCGGPDCAPCPCNDSELALTIVLDNYPGETTWNITDASNTVVASGGPYSGAGSTVTQNISLGAGDHTFTIFDSYGDGICCAYGSGSYSLVDGNGSTVASGGSFSSSESTNFCIGGTTPTCNDGVQNGSETGVDCGGPDCAPCPTCNDGVQNGDETGVDCGGSDCAPCPTCNDGVQNGSETGVDCGGPDCSPCPTCNDGIQNGDESGVDCGGPDCAPCSGCNNGSNLTLTIKFDNYPQETTWNIVSAGGSTVASGGPYPRNRRNKTINISIPLALGDYTFNMFDSYGDGICCSYGNGFYTLSDNLGNTLASGGQFGSSESTPFCTGNGGGARMSNSSSSTASLGDINLFPNPTSGDLTLAFTLPVEGPVEVLVNSVDGRVVLRQQWTAAVGTEVRRLDASQLAPGLYFLHLKANQQHITRKFVVVK